MSLFIPVVVNTICVPLTCRIIAPAQKAPEPCLAYLGPFLILSPWASNRSLTSTFPWLGSLQDKKHNRLFRQVKGAQTHWELIKCKLKQTAIFSTNQFPKRDQTFANTLLIRIWEKGAFVNWQGIYLYIILFRANSQDVSKWKTYILFDLPILLLRIYLVGTFN